MNAPAIKYKVLKPDTHLDCAEFSLCPNCSLHIIRLADGCSICGWSKEDVTRSSDFKSEACESLPSAVLLGGNRKNPRKSFNTSENKLAIPCLIKQPQQPEVKGVIRKVWRDRVGVEIDGEEIAVSKLLVYPDEGKSVGQIEKSPRKNTTPSTNNPRKTRRKKGQGNGTIYYRTATKNGKEYQEAYYHYTENGKKRTLYIPKKLLDRVEEAESQKLPINDILILLNPNTHRSKPWI